MKLTGKCACGCIVTMEDEPAVFANPVDGEMSIEKRFDAWQEEHRACWRAPTIHRLFSRKGPKVYKGAALDSRWKRMTTAELVWYSVAGVVTGAAVMLLLFR